MALVERARLVFVSPQSGAVLGARATDVDVHLDCGDGPFPRGLTLAMLRKLRVTILCNGEPAGEALYPGEGALRYAGTLDTSGASEGPLELTAVLTGKQPVSLENSAPLAVVLDRTGPVIAAVFPSQGVRIA